MTATRRLAVIPARGGSKRLPGKNIRPLLGLPLIAYTIMAARESGLFTEVVVSTDSAEIGAIAQRYGAQVPFTRAAQLADDHTPVSLVTLDALELLDSRGESFDEVAQLMPNCPLRNAEDVQLSYAQFQSSGSESQLSVTRFGWQNPWWAMQRDHGYALDPLFAAQATERSQDLADLFCPTGAIWWSRPETLRREHTFHITGRTGWEIAWQHGVDIDTAADWAMAEVLLGMALRVGGHVVPPLPVIAETP